MNEHLRERIQRKLETLSDDRGYQVLDYVEFLESRYAERPTAGGSPFTRFAEAVEDRLRAGKVSAGTIAEAMNMMNRAANVLNGALAAGRSITNDIVSATRTAGTQGSANSSNVNPAASGAEIPPSTGAAAAADVTSAPEASSPAHDIKMPGSGEEKL
jgi:hypothetical protein